MITRTGDKKCSLPLVVFLPLSSVQDAKLKSAVRTGNQQQRLRDAFRQLQSTATHRRDLSILRQIETPDGISEAGPDTEAYMVVEG